MAGSPEAAFALLLLALIGWMAIPLLPAVFELLRPRDAAPLNAVGNDAGRLTYRAMVDRETYIDGEVQALVDRLFGSRREDLVDFIRRGS